MHESLGYIHGMCAYCCRRASWNEAVAGLGEHGAIRGWVSVRVAGFHRILPPKHSRQNRECRCFVAFSLQMNPERVQRCTCWYVTYHAKPWDLNNYFHQYIALNGTSRMRLAELPCHSDLKPPRLTCRLQAASQPRQLNGRGLRDWNSVFFITMGECCCVT